MQSSQQPRAGWREVSSVVAAVVGVLAAGCGTGGPSTGPNGDDAGPGGPATGAAPPGKAPTACSVTSDTAISAGEATSPAIAYGKDRFAVAWTDLSRDAGDVMLTVVDHDGHTLHEQPIAQGAGTATLPSVARLPSGGFLVVWEDIAGAGGAVRGQRVGEDGTPHGPPFLISRTVNAEAHPDVATTRSGAAVAWTEAGGASIGTVVNEAVENAVTVPGAAQAALASSRDGLAAVWSSGSQIGFAPLTLPLRTAQTAHPSLFRVAPGKANLPRIVAAGSGFIAAWEDNRGGDGNESVRLTRLSADGTASGEIEISPPGSSANYPDVAWLGSTAAVVYYQFRDGPPSVYLSLVSPDLRRVGEELKVSTAHGGARFPRVAYGDGKLGVTYAQRNGPVHLALVDCK